jgi:hypothetical protein
MESPFWLTKELPAYFRITRETLRQWIRDLGVPAPIHNAGQPRGPSRYDRAACLSGRRPPRSAPSGPASLGKRGRSAGHCRQGEGSRLRPGALFARGTAGC